MQITEQYAYILSLSQENEITYLCTCKSDAEGLMKYYDWGKSGEKKFHFLYKLLASYMVVSF